jgi:pimeloyl-ACP methyl ester carboxylesterase
MRWLLMLLHFSVASQGEPKASPDPAGLWEGKLKTGLVDLRLVIRITKSADGAWSGTMDSIDQGAKGLPIDVIEIKERAIRFELTKIKGVYEGTLSEDGKEITGRWKQSGGNLTLTLRRTDKPPELVRPQMPKRPFPYDEQEVTFENAAAKVKLAGTLTAPRGKGRFPAVLLISGSGPQDRDETLFGHKPFLVLADYLTRRGIAVLRCDDRGVGGSSGSTMKATMEDLTQDALAAVAFLKTRADIDPAKIGLIGHSEGGIVAPLAATRSKDVAFIVMLAGTGVPGEELLYLQGAAILKSMGLGEAALKRQRAIQEVLFTAIKQEPDDAKAKKLIQDRLKEFKEKLPILEQVQWQLVQGKLDGQIKTIMTPWFRYLLTHDPQPALRKVAVPVLALVGEKDVQVPPKENLEAIAKALKEGGNRDVTVQEMPGLNHLFQTAKTGAVAEYGQIEETIAPAALELIGEWISRRVK